MVKQQERFSRPLFKNGMLRVITGGTLSKTFFLINRSGEVFANFSMLGILPILLKAEISENSPKMATFKRL